MHKNRPANFAGQKRTKMAKRTWFGPKKAKPGAFWVLEGMGTVVGRCERMGKPGNRAEGLGLRSAPVSSRQSATGARSPLGTRFWSGCGGGAAGSGGAARLRSSPSQVTKERCWFGAVSSFWRRIVHRLPLLPSKEKHLRQEDGQADQDHGRVGPGSVQLRHRVEIHAVPTSN